MRLIDADEFKKREILDSLRSAYFDDEIGDVIESIPTVKHADSVMNDVAELQKGWNKLKSDKHMTKKAICDLVIPFRDKYGLADSVAIQIASARLSIPEINEQINK